MVAKLPVHPAPAGWCVAGPGSLSRSSRARQLALTTRPPIAASIWACGWCGRPPALPDLCALEAASAARLFARVERRDFSVFVVLRLCVYMGIHQNLLIHCH